MSKEVDEKVDNVNPNHYQGTKCIEFMTVALGDKAVYDFCVCNAFKYLWRFKDKNGEEDIKKAKWYLDYAEKIAISLFMSDEEDVHRRRLVDMYIDLNDKIANQCL